MKRNIITCIIGAIILYIGVYMFLTNVSDDIIGKILIFVGGIIAILSYLNIGKLLKLKGHPAGISMNIIGKILLVTFPIIMIFIIISTSI